MSKGIKLVIPKGCITEYSSISQIKDDGTEILMAQNIQCLEDKCKHPENKCPLRFTIKKKRNDDE
jgi:hypothetical protein